MYNDRTRTRMEDMDMKVIHINQAFFLSAPEKNSRTPKLKKMETQEKNSNKKKYPFSGIF